MFSYMNTCLGLCTLHPSPVIFICIAGLIMFPAYRITDFFGVYMTYMLHSIIFWDILSLGWFGNHTSLTCVSLSCCPYGSEVFRSCRKQSYGRNHAVFLICRFIVFYYVLNAFFGMCGEEDSYAEEAMIIYNICKYIQPTLLASIPH